MGEPRMTEPVMSGALFREIHKNAWLKRLPPESKRTGVVAKKGDRVWIVFCVHDDSEAFLEGYSNSKVAACHSPDWFVCLNNTLHISPTICPRQSEYEFVITLNHEVIRLTAPTWESMHDWVEVLRSKLREMRILSPNENMYSKMPEIKPILLPTRDPTSPLPAPPPVPAILVPGVEPVPTGLNNATNHVNNHNSDNVFTYDDFSLENARSEVCSQAVLPECSSDTILPTDNSDSKESTSDKNIIHNEHLEPVISIEIDSEPINDSVSVKLDNHIDDIDISNVTILDTSNPHAVSFSAGCNSLVAVDTLDDTEVQLKLDNVQESSLVKNVDLQPDKDTINNTNITSLFVTNPVKRNGFRNPENGYSMKLHQEACSGKDISNDPQNIGNSNITIIQVSNIGPNNSDQNQYDSNSSSNVDSLQNLFVTKNSYKSNDNVLLLHNNTSEIKNDIQSEPVQNRSEINVLNSSHIKSNFGISTNKLGPSQIINTENRTKIISNNINHEYYEQIFLPSTSNSITNVPVNIVTRIPPKSPKFSLLSKQQRSVSHSELHINRERIHSNIQSPLNENEIASCNTNINASSTTHFDIKPMPSTSSKRDESSATAPIKHILMRGVTELQIKSRPHMISNNNLPHNNLINNRLQSGANRNTQNNGEKRRRSLSSSEATQNETSERNAHEVISNSMAHTNTGDSSTLNNIRKLTLREQQVLQLRQEMNHPGGVRLTLRRKDCLGSIALVDAFGLVWIAGWKQKQHPMLYNALHIGDHLMSICGVPIKCSNDVAKIIRSYHGQYVEFIVRRIPFGRVYAIRKETEGQCLGIIQDSNTATIVDIVPNSLAARHGVPPRAQTCDGLSLTSWVLTEINARPLNLFFKENEVRDRLNAVGKDISILVQPLDLIKQLKKQLKSMRGYKDYIVQ